MTSKVEFKQANDGRGNALPYGSMTVDGVEFGLDRHEWRKYRTMQKCGEIGFFVVWYFERKRKPLRKPGTHYSPVELMQKIQASGKQSGGLIADIERLAKIMQVE
ncbi:hypothetical protein BZJ19_11585 [Salinivibrio proteolyticus]|uniref:hypothetical protein n=1 Tax=Salinivibrio proteolyticus TaxID=334715 RepID=UPI000988B93E|nr:hypothetical protein [Salinivibrio proteolyticus]OOF24013.1 hypothetical protein BZJ19_11585 [Salinivibrio proteolyticus]